MARAAVIVLALANLGYFAWSQGALAIVGLVPADLAATEPHRLARQISPERLRIIPREQERQEREQRERERRERAPDAGEPPAAAPR